MAVFRIEKTKDFTVMSNHHLRNPRLSLKAKGLMANSLQDSGKSVIPTKRQLRNILRGGRKRMHTCLRKFLPLSQLNIPIILR